MIKQPKWWKKIFSDGCGQEANEGKSVAEDRDARCRSRAQGLSPQGQPPYAQTTLQIVS